MTTSTSPQRKDYELVDIHRNSSEGHLSVRPAVDSTTKSPSPSRAPAERYNTMLSEGRESNTGEPVVFALDGEHGLPPDPNKTVFELQFSRKSGSVLYSILGRIFISTVWSALWWVVYSFAGWTALATSNALVIVLGVVLSLLLVFRTNTAYDRWWEARRLWGTVICQVRNLARFIWIDTKTIDQEQRNEKKGAINLLLAFAIATKLDLRRIKGIRHKELRVLLLHVEQYALGKAHPDSDHLPLDIIFHISAYITRINRKGLLAGPLHSNSISALNNLVEAVSHLERIRDSPIPLAYTIQLKQTIVLYLFFLPFQIILSMGWASIIVQFCASFTMLGIDAIANEIENPFGLEPNDLPMDSFVNAIRKELRGVMSYPTGLEDAVWGTVLDI